jgi:transposase
MKRYCGIDLHSNNHVVTISDEQDRRVYEKRLPNDLACTLKALEPHRAALEAIAVESTFNWYWLVDGLMEAGYVVKLVNVAAVKQYEGLKHTDDRYDAFWLAHLMRLGILPTGYIYPKAQRSVRDLARQRMRLVQHCTAHVLSVQNQVWRSTAVRLHSRTIQGLDAGVWPEISDENLRLSIDSGREAIGALRKQIDRLEKTITERVKLTQEYKELLNVNGIGPILAMTIMLEVGDIHRFHSAGQFASYCRCVDSEKRSNGKKKGEANRKNGNPFLAWAFLEAAHFAVRFMPGAKRFYERKSRQRNRIVAIKALAHKIARACFFVLRDHVPFTPERLFAS